ncbi:hypothetical protein CAEBREN_08154 [Caenorhabditis brenneri]|uniref:F-box domain-containing protein n=1 Tax=Caenorhabditis brenneri TaxID=135651 RepID=G0NXJ1_CAEBE|nr:hypothetical protein CAEBREN_08154 [Caenorhabditis brenneri]
MSFPFPRLPLLAIREVIKSMDIIDIFEFSLVSKKSQNLVMSSIPKNSLSTGFTFRKDRFQFELMPAGYSEHAQDILLDTSYRIQGESLMTRVSTDNLHAQWDLFFSAGTPEVEESTRKLFYLFSKTFRTSKFSITFKNDIKEEFAMEMMRFAWGNDFLLDHIEFCLTSASSESIQELLNRCNAEHTSLRIGTKLPEEFKYLPPPGGYKFKRFAVYHAHWVNLDDFLLCRVVHFGTGFPDLTVEYLNGLLKKIVNLESRLENFTLSLRNLPQINRGFAQVVRGLSDSEIERDGSWQKLQFERKDGLKLLLTFFYGYNLRMTIV